MDVLVGAGGWAYFDVPGEDSLSAYARAFPFVEVNSSFYEYPDLRAVARWRKRVPREFQFAIRVNHEVTHRGKLDPRPSARLSLARTARIAAQLRAVAIVLETPERTQVDPRAFEDLIASTDLPCPAALEARAYRGRRLPAALAMALESRDVADVTDFSQQEPRTTASLAYGRMFGAGEGNRWEFTDDELAIVRNRGETTGAGRVIYTFHGVRMYKDSARFLTYLRRGKFPRATRHTGPASLEEVLREAAKFPGTRSQLLAEHGWRVIDWRDDRRIHASALLRSLPQGKFESAQEVVEALRLVPEPRT